MISDSSTGLCFCHFLLLLLLSLFTCILPSTSASQPQLSLVFPLKTQLLPPSRRSPNKLPFRHNISLTVSFSVGTPPQNVSLVLDTGSELSWLRCNNNSTPPPSPPYINNTSPPPSVFHPTLSTSYSPVPCSSPTCTNLTRDFPIPASCDSSSYCHATLTYADFSSSEGTLASDVFHFSGSETPGTTVFGCMASTYSSSDAEEDNRNTGLMGMNRGSLSFVSQMGFPRFSYCISEFDFSGVLLFGDANFSSLVPLNYTPLIQMATPLPYFDRVAYTVQLQGIKVAGKLLNLSESLFEPDHTGAGQTMVDSGTQFSFLLEPVYTALRNEFLNQTSGVLKALDDFVFEIAMDLCYLVPPGNLPNLPTVSLMFPGAEMTVKGGALLYRVPGEVRGNESVQCFTFGNSDLLGVEAYVIGHHHQQNVWVEFDLEKSRIGLGPMRCDLAGKELGASLL